MKNPHKITYVTKEHITNGERMNSSECAVALALKSNGYKKPIVGTVIFVYDDQVLIEYEKK